MKKELELYDVMNAIQSYFKLTDRQTVEVISFAAEFVLEENDLENF